MPRLPTSTASIGPRPGGGDQSSVRGANLALVFGLLRAQPRPRARLAKEARLSKSATSSIVGDLMARGLVTEGQAQREGQVGRPGLAIQVRPDTVAALGVEISADHLTAVALDLTGGTRLTRQRQLGATSAENDGNPSRTLDALAALVRECLNELAESGMRVPRIVVAAPGVILRGTGLVHLSANLGWRDVSVLDHLRRSLGPNAPHLHLENDARLHGIAEYAPYAQNGVSDLVCLTGDLGVGCGIIAHGRAVTGFAGLAGEVGHLPLGEPSRPCRCGRTGCWENEIGLGVFLGLAAEPGDPALAPDVPLGDRLDVLAERLERGEERVRSAIDTVGADLARGVAVLVDVLNPARVVLGGYFSRFEDHLVPLVQARLDDIDIRGEAGRTVVVASRLGLSSAAVGGAVHALDEIFADPAGIPVLPA